jgi:hypothetical protein
VRRREERREKEDEGEEGEVVWCPSGTDEWML